MIKRSVCAVLLSFTMTSVLCAQESSDQDQGVSRHPSRIPPPFAIDACAGKNEGNSCEMETPRGKMTGVCHATPDGAYFACKPDRGDGPVSQGGPGEQGMEPGMEPGMDPAEETDLGSEGHPPSLDEQHVPGENSTGRFRND